MILRAKMIKGIAGRHGRQRNLILFDLLLMFKGGGSRNVNKLLST